MSGSSWLFAPPPDRDALLATVELEHDVLGSLLRNNGWIDLVADLLQPEHFSDPLAARVYSDIVRITGRGGVADVVTLRSAYEAEGLLAEVGGPAYLAGLLEHSRPRSDLPFFARQIVDRWRRRRAVEIADDLRQSVIERLDEEAGPEILGEAAAALAGAAETGAAATLTSWDEDFAAVLAEAQAAAERGHAFDGVPTGLSELDELLGGGLEPGQLVVIGGRTRMGKTVLAQQIALNAARAGHGVAFFALEMSRAEMRRRAVANLSSIPARAFKRGDLSQGQWDAAVGAGSSNRNWPLIYDDRPAPTVALIGTRIRAIARRFPVRVVVVDHLGLLARPRGLEREGLVVTTGANTGALKALAKGLNAVVILVAQVSRSIEAREIKRPNLSDLSWSGSIEQDADAVLFLHRPEVFAAANGGDEDRYGNEKRRAKPLPEQRGNGEIIVAKQRGGPEGIVPIAFNGAIFRITDAPEVLP